jgi:hypothetical protein
LTSAPGRRFVEWYYRLSPPLAAAVAHHSLLAASVRLFLLPAIALAWIWVKTGAIPALLALLLFGIAMSTATRAVRRKLQHSSPGSFEDVP